MAKIESGEDVYDTLFSKQVLIGEIYNDIEFEECRFEECDFSEATFKRCKFINCEFSRCNLSLINFHASRLFTVTFEACKLVGVDWSKADWPSYHVDFELSFKQCVLTGASFFGLALHALKMESCKLHEVDFRDGDFQHSLMIDCDFTLAQFMRTNLRNVDFTDSTDYMINVLENSVKGARFSRYEALNLLESLGVELVD